MLVLTRMFLITLLFSPFQGWASEKRCSYSTYKWNVSSKSVVDYRHVKHSYGTLADYEVDQQTGCTVCEEDQVEITLYGVAPFKVCKLMAENVRSVLVDLIEQGQPIFKVVGYRVGMTRGDPDEQGNRTGFSNHSFGIAVDINDEQNGLYGNCFEFGPQCRLRKGGEWQPGQPGSLTIDSFVVNQMKDIGFKWGGEIKGRQKDFMHFSPSGY